jgi:hypothetical protein
MMEMESGQEGTVLIPKAVQSLASDQESESSVIPHYMAST